VCPQNEFKKEQKTAKADPKMRTAALQLQQQNNIALANLLHRPTVIFSRNKPANSNFLSEQPVTN
jgi:type III secretory pathway component EscU